MNMFSTTSPSVKQNNRSSAASSSRKRKREKAKRRDAYYRVLLILVFVIIAISLVVLNLIRKTVDVEVTVKVREVSFESPDARLARLFNSVKATSLTISQFEAVDLGNGQVEISTRADQAPVKRTTANSTGMKARHITSQDPFANITFESLTLNRLEIKPGTLITMSWDEDEPDSLKISFDGEVSGELGAEQRAEFSCTGCQLQNPASSEGEPIVSGAVTSASGGQVIRFQSRSDSGILALSLPPNAILREHDISTSGKLHFSRLEEGRSISTIIEGNVRFLDSETSTTLTEGTVLDLGQLQHSVIKTVRIDKGISIDLSGRTDTLLIGASGNLQNRAPSFLQWIYVQHKWLLLLEALALVVNMILAALSWLRIFPRPKENSE